jgi:RNA polymerase sigma-70 factor (ECF subfamily)
MSPEAPVVGNPTLSVSRITHGVMRGNRDSFCAYYDAHFELMYREARRLLGDDEHTCMDVVQDAMLKAMRSMKPIDSMASLEQWSRLVVRSTALDWLRVRSRRREQNDLHAAEVSKESTDHLDRQARMAWIEEQLATAEPELRRLISLRYRLGWTLARIAEHFGLKTGAVDGRLRRAIEELRLKAESLEHE